MPISGKNMRKLFYESGYELVPGGGKGSHWKLKKKRCPTVVIPNDVELAKGMEHALLKVLEKVKKGADFMKYHFKVHKEGKGFWAQCIELEGCITQANSKKALDKRMQEALNLYIDEPSDSKDLAALPDDSISISRNVVEVQVDPSIALAFTVRYNRIKEGLTQQEAADKLGFEHINSYQRLESKNCNPTFRILFLLKQSFPDFSVDLAISN